jgi:hypothetical protein
LRPNPFGYDNQVGDIRTNSSLRRALLLLAPAALAVRLLPAQFKTNDRDPSRGKPGVDEPEEIRLPNGKKQQDEILKADYEKNVKDAQELITIAKSFEEDLEKDDRFVLSVSSLKKLDDIEKLTKRIRSRLKRY